MTPSLVGKKRRIPSPHEPRKKSIRRRIRRRRRRVDEWEDRRTKLSNRLTRYAFAKGGGGPDEETRLLRLAEVRMADVVFAAGGIESCHLRIRHFTSALAKIVVSQPVGDVGVLRMTEAFTEPRFGRLVALVPDAYYDFNAMLWWGRALMDRIEGDWGGERVKGVRIGVHRIGLIEFLPKPDARRIRAARDGLLRGAFADVKHLADYSLHAFAVPHVGGPIRFESDGTLTLPLPDRIGRRLELGERFTYDQGRHVGAESDAMWHEVDAFVSGAFDVLEAAQLRREEALPDGKAEFMRHARVGFMPRKRKSAVPGPPPMGPGG